ncbi:MULTISPECIES: PEP/pyruvate-binding domain-containing protein [unclassified Guyparkeria]|uniref:PEP/pyruvate-binding domain-containing protein n=1 Tax=unclassified Guyparkeria TaxID=2626246 RepID=UPI000733765F|nr:MULTISPECIES: PEP/pyruvate-binding domain-containing protein [unclassified Guyparkeria]KTG17268.1 phosphoenolpyruvate synthase [Guyparkeria sp. XI15]OAE87245.1 phosphoenolpyruvate synthase [Guyparkeria sp. WRN-7]
MFGPPTPLPHRDIVRASIRVLALTLVLLGTASPGPVTWADDAAAPGIEEMRDWIEAMKRAPRGPFERIRWFCEDGTVLAPEPYACRPHGGGIQHGQWNERAMTIRAQGYPFATLVAELDPEDFLGPGGQHRRLRGILIERFLIRFDDGWVFRRARFYRGAIQVEDEQRQARTLLLALLDDPYWRDPKRFLTLREAARLLPLGGNRSDATIVRDLAIEIAEADPGFQPLRTKLHGLPDAGDAERVRNYARKHDDPELDALFDELVQAIERLHAPQTAVRRLEQLASSTRTPVLATWLSDASDRLSSRPDLATRLSVTGELAAKTRERVLADNGLSPADRLLLLQASLALEDEAYAVGSQLTSGQPESPASRAERLDWLVALSQSLYGAGLLSARQQKHLEQAVAHLRDTPLEAGRYAEGLAYLSRAMAWAQRAMAFQFDPALDHWATLTPAVRYYIPDRLRDSPLLVYSRVVDPLRTDAARLLGTPDELFGQPVSHGLRALNPGLQRGVLKRAPGPTGAFAADGIYLLPETTADLPPVAGILTRDEGSSLSHVQLLARNLGIPNVVIDAGLIERIEPFFGEPVVLAVSPGGRVQLARDGPEWDRFFPPSDQPGDEQLTLPPGKLELGHATPIPLSRLRSDDAGRRVGPKAANLGELAHHYPRQVSPGLAIPFGVFRQLLDQPIRADGPPARQWLQAEYRRIGRIDDPDRREREIRAVLARLRVWIGDVPLPAGFHQTLHATLSETFGSADTDGIFVRSDTNVEDLPSFSGAGLNRTVPNVVGFEAIVNAIREVWASPFTPRAFAWRQARMNAPEQVYPSVLLQATVPVDKSGVLATVDLDSGDQDWLSIATSEGLGGVVEGQAAEELRVHRDSGALRLLSEATAPFRRVTSPGGGLHRERAEGPSQLLSEAEIERLRALANDVERRALITGPSGGPAPADIEFGFVDGRLALFQIRPLVENRRARANSHLAEMDAPLRQAGQTTVTLTEPPRDALPGGVP